MGTLRQTLSPWILAMAGFTFASLPASAREFQECIADLQNQARESGMSNQLIEILGNAKQRERIIQLDRNQPEFTQTFGMYYDRRVTDGRVRKGRKLLNQYKPFLEQLTEKYGVPPQYLIAFWGMETNFGSVLGRIETVDALATLACDERRSEMFTRELFAALNLMEQHRIELNTLRGSWAGALGHTQMLPSSYQAYAVDADGDDRADLWNSIPDALATAANYLNQLGWQRDLRWGREVKVPDDFDYNLAGRDQRRSLREWKELGVMKAHGRDLGDLDVVGSMIVPMGADGPKFLVYDNFFVIMRWNTSEHYALSVGILADRINGAGDLYTDIPKSDPLTRDQVAELQGKLQEMGFDPGGIDGRLGPATSRAVRGYQQSNNLTPDGFADKDLLKQLGIGAVPDLEGAQR